MATLTALAAITTIDGGFLNMGERGASPLETKSK